VSRAGFVATCPAKINLSLRVLGKRADGYHELRTTFQAIDLHDVLEVRPCDRLRLTVEGSPGLSAGADNLVLRAAAELRCVTGVASGADLRLVKRIPVGGGLGGGSSDAAGALLALERLWDVRPDPATRLAIARDLGADVPFFLVGGRALGRGRGDRLTPIETGEQLAVLVGLPPFGVGTAEVFAGWSDRLTPPEKDVSVRRLSETSGNGIEDVERSENDLEAIAFGRWPVLRRFRDALRENGADTALLSGSGSSVFGVFDTRDSRDRAAGAISSRFPGWEVVKTRSVSDGVRIARLD
jgi:4-diphosphocytidyl-2-C-methyl-D-erythritol kinase